MTQTFAVNVNNDLYLDEFGNIAIVRDLQAIMQYCEQVIKTRLGEIVLDTTIGIPYFETVWNGVPNIFQFESAVRQALLQIDGVLEVVSFKTIILNTNALSYTAVIRTIYGQGTLNG